jgi:electron transfer flavoprotein alpha subunit
MTILVIAEQDNAMLDRATHGTVGAAALIATFTGLDVHVLVAGHDACSSAEAATRIAGVSKVIFADIPRCASDVTDAVEVFVARIAHDYAWILAPATANGKRLASGVAARLGIAPIQRITAVLGAATFERTATAESTSVKVRSSGPVNVITVAAAVFDAAASEGGCAVFEKIDLEEQGRSRSVARDEVLSVTRALGVIGEPRTSAFNHPAVFKALSRKLETAVSASRDFHERMRLVRYSCAD